MAKLESELRKRSAEIDSHPVERGGESLEVLKECARRNEDMVSNIDCRGETNKVQEPMDPRTARDLAAGHKPHEVYKKEASRQRAMAWRAAGTV